MYSGIFLKCLQPAPKVYHFYRYRIILAKSDSPRSFRNIPNRRMNYINYANILVAVCSWTAGALQSRVQMSLDACACMIVSFCLPVCRSLIWQNGVRIFMLLSKTVKEGR